MYRNSISISHHDLLANVEPIIIEGQPHISDFGINYHEEDFPELPKPSQQDYKHIRNNKFNRKWNMNKKHRRDKGRY